MRLPSLREVAPLSFEIVVSTVVKPDSVVERAIAFDKWLRRHRPDIRLLLRRFDGIESAGRDAGSCLEDRLSKNRFSLFRAMLCRAGRVAPDLAGSFVARDTPAMEASRR